MGVGRGLSFVLAATLAGCASGTAVATESADGAGSDGGLTVGPGTESGGSDSTGSITTSIESSASADSSSSNDGSTSGTGDSSSSGEVDSSSSDTGEDCKPEVCDGVDNDCDDEIDEVCDCQSMTEQQCYSGPMDTENVGACSPGVQTCVDGEWGTCDGETLPGTDTCNAIDDDCDGNADEDFGDESCGLGVCYQLVDTCPDGMPQSCSPLDPPDMIENCEGTDDDCDGEIDEGCACLDGAMQGCYPGPMGTEGVGTCTSGMQMCANGQWGACMDAVLPQSETCDGDDDDCDGTDDDGTGGAACQTGLAGVCAAGQQACQGGMLQCEQTVFGGAEICDGLDNDCDAATDEGLGGGACNTGLQGVCSAGTQQCQGGIMNCVQNVPPGGEVCDGLDNDCDGPADEGNPGGGFGCGTGQPGVCSAGTTACSNGMIQCNQNLSAGPEVCDALDNDCDGAVDEGVCLGPPGDCCIASGGDGCESVACTDDVCLVDATCCDTGWDAMCAAEATNSCGGLCTSISTCDEVDLGNGSGLAGTTVGSGNQLAAPCGSETGVEVAIEYTATTSGLHTFDTLGSTFDTVLWAINGCGGASLGCNDDTFGLQSQIFVNLVDGQTIIVAVGGFLGATGNYQLNVTAP